MRKNKLKAIYIPNSEFAARCNHVSGHWKPRVDFLKEQEKLKFKNLK